MKPNMRLVLEQIFEEGIGFGLNRAFKHYENPSRQHIEDSLMIEIWNAWDRWMIDDDRISEYNEV
jgi:hypothetical protein